MNSLVGVVDVLFFEEHFSFHDLYLLSLTCGQFNIAYRGTIRDFMARVSPKEDREHSCLTFVRDERKAQITIKQILAASVFFKRIEFPLGRSRARASCSYFYSGVKASKKDYSHKLDIVIPPIENQKVKVIIPEKQTRETLFHYVRLQRSQLVPRLTEKLFVKVYDIVTSSYLQGTPVNKSLRRKLSKRRLSLRI
jgi:hypothetical protein